MERRLVRRSGPAVPYTKIDDVARLYGDRYAWCKLLSTQELEYLPINAQ